MLCSPPFSPLLSITVAAGGCLDSNLRAWITSQCQDLHARIQGTLVSTPQPDTLASKAAAASSSSSSSSVKKTRRSSVAASTTTIVARDLMPDLEAVSGQLQCTEDPVAWAAGLKRLASLLTKTTASEDESPSPFEVQRSGLLEALQTYLAQSTERRLRIYLLLKVSRNAVTSRDKKLMYLSITTPSLA